MSSRTLSRSEEDYLKAIYGLSESGDAASTTAIATALAVIAHEVPQEVGDFAILLDSGYKKLRALGLNLLSSLATIPGALTGYFALAEARQAIPYILSISAASFIYVAIADLVPGLHRAVGLSASLLQVALIVAGIATIAAIRFSH